MYNVVNIPDNKLQPVETMADLSHAVYQLFPDAFIDIENGSDMIVIYTSLRYNGFDGSLKQKGMTMFYNGFNLMIDAILVAGTAMYMSWKIKRDDEIDYAYWSAYELDHEYNEGYNFGYDYGYKQGRADARDIYFPEEGGEQDA